MITAADLAKKHFDGLKLSEPYRTLLGYPERKFSVLVSGSPGEGKSTLALQIADELTQFGKTLYVAAEEGTGYTMQEKINRLGLQNSGIHFTEWEGYKTLKGQIRREHIKFVVLDSITAVDRYLHDFEDFRSWCKSEGVGLIVVSHATKTGQYKGDSSLAHGVDTVVWVQGKKAETKKNRFGPLSEIPVNYGKVTGKKKRENPDPDPESKKDEIRKGIMAMKKVIETHMDVHAAMTRPDLGPISFIWGQPGKGKKTGFGIAHIIKSRDLQGMIEPAYYGQKGIDIALRLPVVIAKGKITKRLSGSSPRVLIDYAGYRVILREDLDGENKEWVLTGYRVSKRKNPDETAELLRFEQSYAPEAYISSRPEVVARSERKVAPKPEKNKDTGHGITIAEESTLPGLEYIENPDEALRENRSVQPQDIYQMITDMLINTIEKVGHLPWQKEWDDTGIYKGRIATNFVSKNPYRGINFFMLNFEQKVVDGKLIIRQKNFPNPYFMTFNQISERKGTLKKGSAGYKVIYFTRLYKYQQADPQIEFATYDIKKMIKWLQDHRGQINLFKKGYTAQDIARQSVIPILKYYNVFNGEDIEGIDWGPMPENENAELSKEKKIEVAELIYKFFPTAPRVKHQEPRAYYVPSADYINMPKMASFSQEQFYYTTLFHEAIHSTGNKKRLGRDMKGRFGSESYAKEELIAEMGAAYLCAESGILFRTIDNSAKYLQSWNKRLVKNMKKDNKFFFRAASHAQEASDYILHRNKQGIPAYRADFKLRKNPSHLGSDPLIYIGKAEKLEIDNPGGKRVMKGSFPMFVSKKKDRLYIVPKENVHPVKQKVKDSGADHVFDEWHHFGPDETDYAIDWPTEKRAVPVGTAGKIWYASDKMMSPGDQKGKTHHYVHDFDKHKRPASVLGHILVISNVKVDGRGILN